MRQEYQSDRNISVIERSPFSNVQFLLVVGTHTVTTENDFALKRRRIEDLGHKFFQRNFTNAYFLEDAGGSVASRQDELNGFAREHHSFRGAYWHALKGMPEEEALKQVTTIEGNTFEHLAQIYSSQGMSPAAIKTNAFTYAQLTALDNLLRKNIPIQIHGEANTDARNRIEQLLTKPWAPLEGVVYPQNHSSVAPTTIQGTQFSRAEKAKILKEDAKLLQEINSDLAGQFATIINQNPTRLRLLSILGGTHEGVIDNLSPEIQRVTNVERLIPSEPESASVVLAREIQRYDLNESEIIERLEALSL